MNSLIQKVYAVDPINPVPATITNVDGLVTIVITWITYIAGAAALIYLIYSGILFISAAGNPDQAKKGQQGVINAVIGIIVVVLALTIINVAKNAAKGDIAGSEKCTTPFTTGTTSCPDKNDQSCVKVVKTPDTDSLVCIVEK